MEKQTKWQVQMNRRTGGPCWSKTYKQQDWSQVEAWVSGAACLLGLEVLIRGQMAPGRATAIGVLEGNLHIGPSEGAAPSVWPLFSSGWVVPDRWWFSRPPRNTRILHAQNGIQNYLESFRVRSHCFVQHEAWESRTPDISVNMEGPPVGTKSLVSDGGCGRAPRTQQGCGVQINLLPCVSSSKMEYSVASCEVSSCPDIAQGPLKTP